MRELALFAGCGGGMLGTGFDTVAACESDPVARRVLLRHWHGLHIHPDIHGLDGREYRGRVDVVTGGFPCQAHSTASRGRKVAKDLWPEMFRIVREVEPTHVFAENVQRKPIQRAAGDLAGLGYMVHCAVIGGSHVGAPHRRRRVWLLATHPDDSRQRAVAVYDRALAGIRHTAAYQWGAPPPDSVLGMDDGPPGRSHRMRLVGNAQMPRVAQFAWYYLLGEQYASGYSIQ